MGLHSGYPECCVEEFVLNGAVGVVHQADLLRRKKERLGAAASTVYYVPCWSCVEKIVRGERPPVPRAHHCASVRSARCVELITEFSRLTGKSFQRV